jgi:hypothetical protein
MYIVTTIGGRTTTSKKYTIQEFIDLDPTELEGLDIELRDNNHRLLAQYMVDDNDGTDGPKYIKKILFNKE